MMVWFGHQIVPRNYPIPLHSKNSHDFLQYLTLWRQCATHWPGRVTVEKDSCSQVAEMLKCRTLLSASTIASVYLEALSSSALLTLQMNLMRLNYQWLESPDTNLMHHLDIYICFLSPQIMCDSLMEETTPGLDHFSCHSWSRVQYIVGSIHQWRELGGGEQILKEAITKYPQG